MADKDVKFETVEANEVVVKAKDFWAKFSKPIIYVGGTLIVLIVGWLAYKNFVTEPNEQKAAEMIFPAEQLFDKMAQAGFNKDSVNLVLNGGNGITGVLKIISKYGGTDAGNRSEYIAGACYLHTGDFANAVKHLKEFSTKATQVQTTALLMLGDAYAEQKKNDEAFSAYKKAAAVNEKDEFMTPEALFRAALFAETTGNTKDAIELFQKLKDEFPKNNHANEADKYLARLGVIK